MLSRAPKSCCMMTYGSASGCLCFCPSGAPEVPQLSQSSRQPYLCPVDSLLGISLCLPEPMTLLCCGERKILEQDRHGWQPCFGVGWGEWPQEPEGTLRCPQDASLCPEGREGPSASISSLLRKERATDGTRSRETEAGVQALGSSLPES